MQFDEKWSFVQKKEKNCDENNPADARCGDCWDHVAFDGEHKLALTVVVGKRKEENTMLLVQEAARRVKYRVPRLITSDEYKVYKKAILEAFGERHVPEPTGLPCRPRSAFYVPPDDLVYATVHKTRENGRVTKIDYRTVFGTEEQVQAALKASSCSRKVNTSFIERHNGTDRNRCSRKVRKSYCFSKNWDIHRAATCLSYYSYNFCWPVRTLHRLVSKIGPEQLFTGREKAVAVQQAVKSRLVVHVI
jgi:IS1 family transposase